jgi:hypothetical protein
MMQLHFQSIILRDLQKLKDEINSYSRESTIWEPLPGTSNCGGNLTLHLIGNLRHFIGAELGNSGYIRDRETEFNSRNVPLATLNMLLEECINEVTHAFYKFDPGKMSQPFPKEIGGQTRETAFALLHLTGHLSYHLGQINYHRRYFNSLHS